MAHYQVAGDLAAGRLVLLPITFEKKLITSNIFLVVVGSNKNCALMPPQSEMETKQ